VLPKSVRALGDFHHFRDAITALQEGQLVCRLRWLLYLN